MDREQDELQFLSFSGICKESINIIFSWGKIFSKISFTLILPLSCIFLAHAGISAFLSTKIINNEFVLDFTRAGSPAYNRASDMLSSEWATYWLVQLAYITFLLIFSLLSTSAVVYTIACIYTGKEITFKKVMSVVPKVWKRVMVTFLWNFGIIVIWQLASVVSVTEESYGIQAMVKSKGLVKGKLGIACATFLVFYLCLVGIQTLFERSEVFWWGVGIGGKVGYGIVCLVLLTLLFLVGLVAQTIIYFVCKSYHHENIDKSSLADHLEVYLGEYVPLNAKNIQLEQFHV
ncbi:hypothetical protein Cgig2_018075 [Carnegiea gigantea]|uniref:Uncharacterized protein n=1 Tax=Carnegiea gigantea TaxID=171969 RepID=A0A9Q1GS00_9CARY|nr:hypothetical protein Cgig2_018075 [Carnegiea gigantea]